MIDVVVKGHERADIGVEGDVLIENRSVKNQVNRGGVVIDRRVGHRLEGFGVAHIVGGDGQELVIEAVFECVGESAVGMATADGGVGVVIDGDKRLDISHTRAARIILGRKGEGAVEGVLRVEFRMECGGRGHNIKGIAPHVSADGFVLVEHDEGFCRNGVAGLHAVVGQDVKADIALAMLKRVVDGQETHLGTGGLGTGGRVNALENPEQLVVHDVNAGVYIHPDA